MTNLTNSNQFVSRLKVGDKVVVYRGFRGYSAQVVERLTLTQIVVAGVKFNRTTGSSVGKRTTSAFLLDYNSSRGQEALKAGQVKN